MALDPRMILSGAQSALAAGQSNPLGAMQQGQQVYQNLLRLQAEQQALEQAKAAAPLQQQLMQQKVQAGQLGLDKVAAESQSLKEAQALKSLRSATDVIKPFIQKGDLIGAASQLESLKQYGLHDDDIKAFDRVLSRGNLDEINSNIAIIENLSDAAEGEGDIIKGSQRIVNIDGRQFSEVDVALPNGKLKTVKTPVGGEIAKKTTGLTAKEQSELDVMTASKKARAELMADLDIKPSVQAAVETAIQTVKSSFEQKEEKRSDEKAFKVYETALGGLFDSLQGVTTGPIVGFLPALTADQQIADGAVAAMGPVLKGVFRSAGEGTFTDKDQQLLQSMLPDRRTAPEARARQIATVDAIVRSKMGQPVNVMSVKLGREVSMSDVFETAVNRDLTVDQVKQQLGIQ